MRETISIGFSFLFPRKTLYLQSGSGKARLKVLFPKVLHCVTLHSHHEDGNCMFWGKKLQSVCLPPLQFSNRGSVQKSVWKCVHLEWPPPRAVPSDEVRGVITAPQKKKKANTVLKKKIQLLFNFFYTPVYVGVLSVSCFNMILIIGWWLII